MILHERAKRVELLSARHATLESEAEKSGSENGSGECSKKQPIFACFLQQFLVVNKMQFFVVNKIQSNFTRNTSTYLSVLINFLSQTCQLVYICYALNLFSSHVTQKTWPDARPFTEGKKMKRKCNFHLEKSRKGGSCINNSVMELNQCYVHSLKRACVNFLCQRPSQYVVTGFVARYAKKVWLVCAHLSPKRARFLQFFTSLLEVVCVFSTQTF